MICSRPFTLATALIHISLLFPDPVFIMNGLGYLGLLGGLYLPLPQLARWRVPMRWIVPAAQAAGVVNRYEEPWTLSPARWTSLIAARARVLAAGGPPAPCVVVGAGTLITVDALDADGSFRGGVALPGLNAMQKMLGESSPTWRTARGHWSDFPANNADAAARAPYRSFQPSSANHPLIRA